MCGTPNSSRRMRTFSAPKTREQERRRTAKRFIDPKYDSTGPTGPRAFGPVVKSPQILVSAAPSLCTGGGRRHNCLHLAFTLLWQQNENVVFEQSRNVVLTAPSF